MLSSAKPKPCDMAASLSLLWVRPLYPQHSGTKSSVQPDGGQVAGDNTHTLSPNAGKAPLGTSDHGPRTSLITCMTHTAPRAQCSCRPVPTAVGEAEGFLSRGVRESGASMKEEQAGVFPERRAPSRAPLPEPCICLPRPHRARSLGAAEG